MKAAFHPMTARSVRIVGDAGLKNFLALAVARAAGFSADDLRDLVAVGGEESVGGGGSVDLADVEDKVVLLQPVFFFVGLDQRGSGALEFLADDAAGQIFEVGVRGPVGGEFDQLLPVAGERELEDQADYAVIEYLISPLRRSPESRIKGSRGSATGGRW